MIDFFFFFNNKTRIQEVIDLNNNPQENSRKKIDHFFEIKNAEIKHGNPHFILQ